MEFQSDVLTVQLLNNAERLTDPYDVFGDIQIPAGRYEFNTLSAKYELGTQRPLSGEVLSSRAGFTAEAGIASAFLKDSSSRCRISWSSLACR